MLIHNDARVSSDQFDPDNSNNIVTEDTTVLPANANLALLKTGPPGAGAGEQINYALSLDNNGNADAKEVDVSDFIPGALKLISVTPTQGSCVAGEAGNPLRPLVCHLGLVSPGSGADIAIIAQVKADVEGDTIFFNDAQATTSSNDPDNSDNVSSVQTTTTATCSVLPSVPTQISPANGGHSPPKVLFDWSDANCALKYRVRVRQDAPNGPLVANSVTKKSQIEIGPLAKNHTYFWRVRTCNGLGCVNTPSHSVLVP